MAMAKRLGSPIEVWFESQNFWLSVCVAPDFSEACPQPTTQFLQCLCSSKSTTNGLSLKPQVKAKFLKPGLLKVLCPKLPCCERGGAPGSGSKDPQPGTPSVHSCRSCATPSLQSLRTYRSSAPSSSRNCPKPFLNVDPGKGKFSGMMLLKFVRDVKWSVFPLVLLPVLGRRPRASVSLLAVRIPKKIVGNGLSKNLKFQSPKPRTLKTAPMLERLPCTRLLRVQQQGGRTSTPLCPVGSDLPNASGCLASKKVFAAWGSLCCGGPTAASCKAVPSHVALADSDSSANDIDEEQSGDGLMQEPWVCPICQAQIRVLAKSLAVSKKHHWQSRHPDRPLAMIQAEKPLQVCASEQIPIGNREWACPVEVCNAGLPPLASQPMKRAKRKHTTSHGYTLRQLFALSAKGKDKSGTSKAPTAGHNNTRL